MSSDATKTKYDLSMYKLILLMYCLEDSYEFDHSNLHLVDVDDIDEGIVRIYSVVYIHRRFDSLKSESTDSDLVDELCDLYGLKKLDMELYNTIKTKFDNGELE